MKMLIHPPAVTNSTVNTIMSHIAFAKIRTCLIILNQRTQSFRFIGLHVASFSMFVVCSVLYLSVTCLLHSASHKETSWQKTGWKWKWISWLTNVTSLVLAAYFYRRHNKYCERHSKSNDMRLDKFVIASGSVSLAVKAGQPQSTIVGQCWSTSTFSSRFTHIGYTFGLVVLYSNFDTKPFYKYCIK